MERLNDHRLRLVLIGLVAAIVFGSKSAKADFVFGEPTNLGPSINSSSHDGDPSISSDGLELYLVSYNRPGGFGNFDIWLSTRATTNDTWGEPANLGSGINSPSFDGQAQISADDLSLFFVSDRPGGSGNTDIWIITQRTSELVPEGYWGTPTNLGSTVNSSASESFPCISADGLSLYFASNRPGGFGGQDLYVTRRETTADPWDSPMNSGPRINSSSDEWGPRISADDLSLFFSSTRPGGYRAWDAYMATRTTVDDDWGEPVNLGPIINSSPTNGVAAASADGAAAGAGASGLGLLSA